MKKKLYHFSHCPCVMNRASTAQTSKKDTNYYRYLFKIYMETRGRDLWHCIVQSNLLSSRLTLLLFRKEYRFNRCGLRSTRQKIVKFYVDNLIIIIMGDWPRRPTKRPAFLNDYSVAEDEVKTKKSKKNNGPKSTSTTARSAGQAGAGASGCWFW